MCNKRPRVAERNACPTCGTNVPRLIRPSVATSGSGWAAATTNSVCNADYIAKTCAGFGARSG
jgi:hypothetical protein